MTADSSKIKSAFAFLDKVFHPAAATVKLSDLIGLSEAVINSDYFVGYGFKKYLITVPIEVVDFFCEHHSKEVIAKDIEKGFVSILKIDENIVATGCFVDNHITRVYVLPECQKKGYGTFIMKTIEAQIGEKYDKAYLDASLPAAAFYEKLGFSTIKHERYPVENGVILAYEIMEKELHQVSSAMNDNGR